MSPITALAEKLDTEVDDPHLLHPRHVLGGRLGGAVVDGVAAADVGDQRMRGAGAVVQVDLVRVARAAAVFVARAGAEGVAKNAVLHVEHRHVLVNDRLKPVGGEFSKHRRKLLPVQVITRRHPHNAVLGH